MSETGFLTFEDQPIPERAERLIADAMSQVRNVECFDFVPSDYRAVWKSLAKVRTRYSELSRPTFCEWGSGLGVVTGLAELLGFIATGIEIDEPLAESSRQLLSHHQLEAKILTGSYFDLPVSADVVFVYCWPGRMPDTRARFVEIGTSGSLLMMCHGASDIRCQTYDDVAHGDIPDAMDQIS